MADTFLQLYFAMAFGGIIFINLLNVQVRLLHTICYLPR